jgi:hypothetical protein
MAWCSQLTLHSGSSAGNIPIPLTLATAAAAVAMEAA